MQGAAQSRVRVCWVLALDGAQVLVLVLAPATETPGAGQARMNGIAERNDWLAQNHRWRSVWSCQRERGCVVVVVLPVYPTRPWRSIRRGSTSCLCRLDSQGLLLRAADPCGLNVCVSAV